MCLFAGLSVVGVVVAFALGVRLSLSIVVAVVELVCPYLRPHWRVCSRL